MSTTKVRAPGRIKSSILKWLGVPFELTSSEFWSSYAQWTGRESWSGKTVTVDSAMQIATVWACVRIIAGTIATLPLKLYRRKGEASEPALEHPLYELLRYSPNSYVTAVTFWEAMVASMLLHGNAWAEKRSSAGRIVALDFLIPSRLTIRRLQFGDLEYRYVDLDGKTRIIAEDDVLSIPAFTLDGVCGLSAIAYGVNVLGGAMAADEAAGKTFKNGLNSQYAFKMDRVLQKHQREEFREALTAMRTAANSGGAPLLEAGLDIKTLSINPDDAQLLESRAFSVEEICRWFQVPPFMVGHMEKSTSWGTGLEQGNIGFLTYTLRPWLARIEQGVRRHLLKPAERATYYAEFSVEGLLRADSAGRAAFYSQMVQNGIYTRDDCRAKENLPRRGGNADELTVQSNLLPIEKLGEANSADAAKLALRSWLKEEKSDEPQERRDQGS